MTNSRVLDIGLLQYPGALSSAIFGLTELLSLANRISARYTEAKFPEFQVTHWRVEGNNLFSQSHNTTRADILIVPPSIEGTYYQAPDRFVLQWLAAQHRQGTTVCSACVGAFILAAAGLLDQRQATTHWNFAAQFKSRFPQVQLDTDRLLINDGDIITAGGVMAWLDLGLELVAQYTRPAVMMELGKLLVIDTGHREQRYYKQFTPLFTHGNSAILKAQHYIQKHYREADLTVKTLAKHSLLGERTFLRNFTDATGLTPLEYLQRTRIQKSQTLLETSNAPIEQIALQVGYEDPSAFRKIFKRLTGLTPREFRQRFAT